MRSENVRLLHRIFCSDGYFWRASEQRVLINIKVIIVLKEEIGGTEEWEEASPDTLWCGSSEAHLK